MITSTQLAPRPKRARSLRAAFTLAEVLIAAALGTMIMSAVLGTVIALTKAGYNAENYAEMESQARKGLELFARDVRMANTITWNSTAKITLRIPTGSGASAYDEYTYEYTNGNFYRTKTYPTATTPQALFSGIEPNSFKLVGFKISVDPATMSPYQVDLSNLAQASTDTKQLQLSIKLQRTRALLSKSTGDVISARFILRNKQVAN
jgi:hypothetical protein